MEVRRESGLRKSVPRIENGMCKGPEENNSPEPAFWACNLSTDPHGQKPAHTHIHTHTHTHTHTPDLFNILL